MNTAKLILFGIAACITTTNIQAQWDIDGKWPIKVVDPVTAKNHKTLDLIDFSCSCSGYTYKTERTQRPNDGHSLSLAGKGGTRDHYPRPRPQNKNDLDRLPPMELAGGNYDKHRFSLTGKGGARDHYPRPRPQK